MKILPDSASTSHDWSSISTTLTKISATLVLGYAIYWTSRTVNEYGWDGLCLYMWNGDPLPPEIRVLVDQLDDIETQLDNNEKRLALIEKALQAARANSASPEEALQAWREKSPHPDLRKELSIISHGFDEQAARLDQVMPSAKQGTVKPRKKALSSRVVGLMERTDVLIQFHNQAMAQKSNAK